MVVLPLCPDSYHAMMVMGANYRSQYHPKMVGVTGSVGKTTILGWYWLR